MRILTNLYGAPRVNGENFIPANEKNLKSPSGILMDNGRMYLTCCRKTMQWMDVYDNRDKIISAYQRVKHGFCHENVM